MDTFYYNDKLSEYYNYAESDLTNRGKLFELCEFYEELILSDSEYIIEAFLTETIEQLENLLELYIPYGIEPEKTSRVLNTIKKIVDHIKESESLTFVKNQQERISAQLLRLNKRLDGIPLNVNDKEMSFTAIKRTVSGAFRFGSIQYLNVSLNKNRKSNSNEFHVIPSHPKIEQKLYDQIRNSWEYAVKYFKSVHDIKLSPFEITIKFTRKLGFVEGDSLGVTLTTKLIIELFNFFDMRDNVSVNNNITATGSVGKNGDVGRLSKEIVEMKTYAAFYSLANIFIVPFNDFEYANNIYKKELKKYPNRVMDIMPVRKMSEVIHRRDIMEIKKQSIIKWGVKILFKSKALFLLVSIIFALMLFIVYTYDDDNPHSVDYTSKEYVIKNKLNEVLWKKPTKDNLEIQNESLIERNYLIVDFEKDGITEVLISDDITQNLILYTHHGIPIWEFKFSFNGLQNRSLSFMNEFFATKPVGVTEYDNRNILIGITQHHPYYPTAIHHVDLLSGKMVNDILWHGGEITGALMVDVDSDGIDELVCAGINNGLESAVVFAIETDKLMGQSPTSFEYSFVDLPIAEFKHYILLPKPDYFIKDIYKDFQPFGPPEILTNKNTLSISLVKRGENKSKLLSLDVRINFDFSDIEIIFSNKFITERDEMILDGDFDGTLTNTAEYHNLLMNQIEYWDGKKFKRFVNQSTQYKRSF